MMKAPPLNDAQLAKYKHVTDGTDYVYKNAKKPGVKLAFGTDTAARRPASASQRPLSFPMHACQGRAVDARSRR